MSDILCGLGTVIAVSRTFGSKVWSDSIAFSLFRDVVMQCCCKPFTIFVASLLTIFPAFSRAVYGLVIIWIVFPFMPVSGVYFFNFCRSLLDSVVCNDTLMRDPFLFKSTGRGDRVML